MSWETKQDYCGLTIASSLTVKSANEGRTAQYLEKHGSKGDYKATKVFGNRATATNTYIVEANATITGKKLGGINTVDSKKYMLTYVKFSTGADAEPTVDGSAMEVESAAAVRNYFAIPEFSISPDNVAQIPAFKTGTGSSAAAVAAFTLSGSGCELTEVSGEISCSGKTNDKNGDPKAHDVTNGHIVLQVTIVQYGNAVPTLTAAQGWDVSSPLSCEDPDSDFPTWNATLSMPLTKTMASQS